MAVNHLPAHQRRRRAQQLALLVVAALANRPTVDRKPQPIDEVRIVLVIAFR